MKKTTIVPHLWFDSEAIEAVLFYTSIFPNSDYISKNIIRETPSGACEEITFTIDGHMFYAINGGPHFTKTPAVSFILNFDPDRFENAKSVLDKTWAQLIDGGKALMPLDKYDFSERFGWVEDKFGVSWQLILSDSSGEDRPFVTPSFLFCDEVFGKAEKAQQFYTDVFHDSALGLVFKYEKTDNPKEEGKLMYGDFRIANQWMAVSDSGYNHGFTFSEGISFVILCETQEDVNYYWKRLSSAFESEQCGWCRDQFGVSWQILPKRYTELMDVGNVEQSKALTQDILKMKKCKIAEFIKSYEAYKALRSTIEVCVNEDIEKVWEYWTNPDHIKNWYFANDEWYVSHASNDVQVDGKLVIGMAAKDGSVSFDFIGVYSKVEKFKTLIFILADQRKVIVEFQSSENQVVVKETFDQDSVIDTEYQTKGWQEILNRFKVYAESFK